MTRVANDDMPDDTQRPVEETPAQEQPGQASAENPPPASAGAHLKWARERAGLTVNDVAARLRLHPAQVRAIEDENFKTLPEAAYVRGFVRSYARILDVPVEPLLADLAPKLGPTSADVIERMARERDYSPVRAAAREQASRRVVLWGAVLLLIALGFVGWYASRASDDARAGPAPAPMPAAVAVTPVAAPAAVAAEAAPSAEAAPDSAAVVPGAAVTPVAAAEPVPSLEPVPPPPLLKLRFTGTSWTEVKDAEGKVLHSQHDAAGTEVVIEGTPPFYVVLGDANKATVEVRGEVYDLSAHTRQNVARFTVN